MYSSETPIKVLTCACSVTSFFLYLCVLLLLLSIYYLCVQFPCLLQLSFIGFYCLLRLAPLNSRAILACNQRRESH